MNDLTKETAEILNIIVETSLNNNNANPRNLPPLNNDITSSDNNVKFHDYSYYVKILEKSDFVTVKWYMESDFSVSAIGRITLEFLEKGGYVNLYKEQEKQGIHKNKIESLEFKKLKWDAVNSEFLAKTRWWPLIIALASFVFSIFALFK